MGPVTGSAVGRPRKASSTRKGPAFVDERVLFALLAYASLLAFTAVLHWGTYASFATALVADGDAAAVDSLVRKCAFPATLLAVGAVSCATGRLTGRVLGVVSMALFGLGAATLLAGWLAGNLPLWLLVAVSLCFSVGMGLSYACAQYLLSRLDVRAAEAVVVASAILSPLIHLPFELVDSKYALVALFVVLFPLCAFFFCKAGAFARRDGEGEGEGGGAADRARTAAALDAPAPTRAVSAVPACASLIREFFGAPGKGGASLAKPFFSTLILSFIVGLTQSWHGAASDGLGIMLAIIRLAGLLAAGAILLAVWRRSASPLRLEPLYTALMMLTATGYALLPMLDTLFATGFVGFIYVSFSIGSLLMVMTCCRFSRERGVDPLAVYGLFAGSVYLSMSVGYAFGAGLFRSEHELLTVLMVVALVAVYLILSVSLLGGRKGRERERGRGWDAHGATGEDAGCGRANDQVDAASAASVIVPESFQLDYRLSDREFEIVGLLARGRSVPAIAKMLCISENTVRTHTKHIYEKAGVHTKQELLDLCSAPNACAPSMDE